MMAKPSAQGIGEMVGESEIDFEGFDLDIEISYIKKEKVKKMRKKCAKNVTN